jgi:hypothetical protein
MAIPDALIAAAIPLSALIGILFAVFLWNRVAAVQLTGARVLSSQTGREYLLEEEQRGGEEEVRGAISGTSVGCACWDPCARPGPPGSLESRSCMPCASR